MSVVNSRALRAVTSILPRARAARWGERETNHQFLQVTLRTFSQGENAPFHFPRLALVRISFISLRRPRLVIVVGYVSSAFSSTRNGISICGL